MGSLHVLTVGHFLTSTVALGDWICKIYSEVSQNKSECVKMKHVQHCIHFLLVIFKRVIFFLLG